jgi:hypothetical protein
MSDFCRFLRLNFYFLVNSVASVLLGPFAVHQMSPEALDEAAVYKSINAVHCFWLVSVGILKSIKAPTALALGYEVWESD